MSVSGICEICAAGEVEHTCSRCAQLVCDEHFDEETGLCVECVADVGAGRGDRQPSQVPDDMPDGVDTYEF
jgi:hypothetical protein